MKSINQETDLNKVILRQRKVIELAEQQLSYQYWYDLQKKTKQDFDAFLQQQPPDVQSILLSYVGSCQMISQRLLNIACEYMDFIDPAQKK